MGLLFYLNKVKTKINLHFIRCESVRIMGLIFYPNKIKIMWGLMKVVDDSSISVGLWWPSFIQHFRSFISPNWFRSSILLLTTATTAEEIYSIQWWWLLKTIDTVIDCKKKKMKTIKYDSKSLVDDCSFLLAANDKNTAKSVRVLITHGYRYCFTRSLAFAEDIASKQIKRTLVTNMFTELIIEEINTDKIQYNNLIRDTSSISMEETIRQTIVSIMESLTTLSSPRPNIFCAPTVSFLCLPLLLEI